VVERLLPGLQDPGGRVRALCAEALAVIADPGDACASCALATSLGDVRADVRQAAAAALQRLVGPDDAEAIGAVAVQLEAGEVGGRRAAMHLLRELAAQGSSQAAAALARHAEHTDKVARSRSVFGAFSQHRREWNAAGATAAARDGRCPADER